MIAGVISFLIAVVAVFGVRRGGARFVSAPNFLDGLYVALQSALSVPLGFLFSTIGTRYISAPETTLFLLLQTLLSPLLVWAVLGEPVGMFALIGGLGIVTIVGSINLAACVEELRGRKGQQQNATLKHSEQDDSAEAG